MQINESKVKSKQTCLERYGVEHHLQLKEFINKQKRTKLERYGDKNYCNGDKISKSLKSKSKEEWDKIVNKQKRTKLERYGYLTYNNINKFKKTCLERYGVENPYQLDCVKEQIKKTNLERYGKEYYSQTKDWKDLWKDKEFKEKIIDKIMKTCNERYGKEYYSQTKEYKDLYKDEIWARNRLNKIIKTCLERYGVEYYIKLNDWTDKKFKNKMLNLFKFGINDKYGVDNISQTKDWKDLWKDKEFVKRKQEKEYRTKKKNNSFNSSKPQKILEKELKKIYPSLRTEYKSKDYPFCCDFYIPSKDLYVELNLHWTHGPSLYDEGNEGHKRILSLWQEKSNNSKFYINAIDVWTVRDVEKLRVARVNRLNYLTFYKWDKEEILNKIKEF